MALSMIGSTMHVLGTVGLDWKGVIGTCMEGTDTRPYIGLDIGIDGGRPHNAGFEGIAGIVGTGTDKSADNADSDAESCVESGFVVTN